MEEMTRVSARRKMFNEQAHRLMDEVPALQDEVNWRLSHLNSKWEQVESALSSTGCSRCEQESCPGKFRFLITKTISHSILLRISEHNLIQRARILNVFDFSEL